MNLSNRSNVETASTNNVCALQRAENLYLLGVKRVLELCVGPSLKTLEKSYSKFGITVVGNDIDPRWKDFYPGGSWIIGDALSIDKVGFDAVVVAPPLSKGCSGKREDSLSLDKVVPSYYNLMGMRVPVVVYVLPGRTLSVKQDRGEFHKFLSQLEGIVSVVPLIDGVVKYVDVYVELNV